MVKVKFSYGTGYCGEDGGEIMEFGVLPSEEDLNTMAWNQAIQHGESYGHVYMEDSADLKEAGLDEYEDKVEFFGSTNLEGYWEIVEDE